MKQEVVVVVIETIKSEICVKNINFFNFTMQINLWEKFRISVFSASFLQHLIEVVVKYKKKSILKFFFQCLRDSACKWFNDQLKFMSLNDFETIFVVAFSLFIELVANLDSIIINSSSRFHICFECDVQFSSISRLLTHAQKSCNKVYTCKHCEKIFTSNNKFHKHVRLRHIKKSYNNKTLKQRFVEREDNHINLSISRFIFSITFKSITASAKSSYLFIIMTKAQVARFIEFSIDSSITSTNLIVLTAFKSSHSHKYTRMSFTFSSSSSQTSMLKHQKQHRKSYFIINDLFEMFAEKSNKKNMNITQKKSIFSCFFEFR